MEVTLRIYEVNRLNRNTQGRIYSGRPKKGYK